MTYDDDVTPREKKISRVLAIGMHVAFVVLLIFGVSWQRRYSEPAAVVDLWSSMSPPKEEPAPPKPVPKAEPKPEAKPKPEPKPVPPPPKPEAKPIAKADIALKEKLEKEKKLKEERELEKKKQQELEKRKEDEAKKVKAEKQQRELEAKKKDDEKKKLEQQRVAQEQEAKKQAAEKQALADKLAKQQAAAQNALYDKFIAQIKSKVRSKIPDLNVEGNPEAVFELRVLPGGDIMDGSVRLVRSSGNPAYDRTVERAIIASSPLPVPSDPTGFNMFRELNLKIRPRE